MTRKIGYRIMVFMSRQMIACDEASFLVSLREDHGLGIKQWWQLNFHLFTCRLCRRYARQIKELDQSMDQYNEICGQETCLHHLSNDASDKLQHALESELNSK